MNWLICLFKAHEFEEHNPNSWSAAFRELYGSKTRKLAIAAVKPDVCVRPQDPGCGSMDLHHVDVRLVHESGAPNFHQTELGMKIRNYMGL